MFYYRSAVWCGYAQNRIYLWGSVLLCLCVRARTLPFIKHIRTRMYVCGNVCAITERVKAYNFLLWFQSELFFLVRVRLWLSAIRAYTIRCWYVRLHDACEMVRKNIELCGRWCGGDFIYRLFSNIVRSKTNRPKLSIFKLYIFFIYCSINLL